MLIVFPISTSSSIGGCSRSSGSSERCRHFSVCDSTPVCCKSVRHHEGQDKEWCNWNISYQGLTLLFVPLYNQMKFSPFCLFSVEILIHVVCQTICEPVMQCGLWPKFQLPPAQRKPVRMCFCSCREWMRGQMDWNSSLMWSRRSLASPWVCWWGLTLLMRLLMKSFVRPQLVSLIEGYTVF